MAIPPKPFAMVWPLTAQQVADLDRMLFELYDELALLDASGSTTTGSGASVSMAQVLTRVIHGT